MILISVVESASTLSDRAHLAAAILPFGVA
jgi:hypothetical protein